MAENLFFMGNGYSALTKLTGSVSTQFTPATSVVGAWQPLLQLSASAVREITIVEYGVSMSGSPAGAQLSLISTDTSNPVTGAVAGISAQYSNPGGLTSQLTFGTSNCCYYTAANGGPTGTVKAIYDQQLLTTNTYVKQFPLAREPTVNISNFLNINLYVPTTAVNCFAYVIWRE